MPILGELENAIMAVLWERTDPTSVRDVHEELQRGRTIAYTTVMTVLDRLAKKKLVTRALDGRAWLYRPAQSRVELYVAAINDVLLEVAPDERVAISEAVYQGQRASETAG